MESQNYEIALVCKTEIEGIPVKRVNRIIESSLFDALLGAIESFGNALLDYTGVPESVDIELSGHDDEGNLCCMAAKMTFKEFRWEKNYEGFEFFNEEGIEPFSYDWKWLD